ncbi:transglycosylase domain-containing protein [Microbacterium sp. bgisy189]|uniref:transglycosylase domain-containing protein n=1 Tax=Microbacterium sp. bgisy189 TaxID=3413798 RepID=UPI003EBD9E40
MPHKKRTASGVLGGLLGLTALSAIAGVLVTATVTPALAVSGYAASSAITMFDKMPSYLEIDKLMLPTEIYVLDEDDEYVKLTEFYDQNRIPVTFDQVNPVMYDAILSSEDKNFYSHGGVDLVGTLGALAEGEGRGGSSITQQYVKNVLQQNCEFQAVNQDEVDACFAQTTVSVGADGYKRKLQEMRYAIQLEKEYSKDEILIGYLNIASFGGSVYGIGAAAQYYFSKSAKNLTIAEAATIAGMVQEPNKFRIDIEDSETNGAENGYALTTDRRDYVLRRMLEDGKITQEEHDEARASEITPKITEREQGCDQADGAKFFCDYVTSIIASDTAFGETDDDRKAALRRGGLKIYTTLDYDLQKTANEAIDIVPANRDDINLGASGIQVEVGTGRILSMVQNRPYEAAATEDDGKTTAVNYNVRRQSNGGGHSAGSTYKLFSLLNWMEQGHSVNEFVNGRVGTKTVETCDGATATVEANNNGGIGNFERNPGYTGTVARFTKDSLNSGFFAMAEQISVCTTNQLAMKLGVRLDNGGALDQNNYPFNVLGDQAVAPLDMAQAYATVASGGIYCEPKSIDRVVNAQGEEQAIPETKCERVLSEAVANTAAFVLEDVMNGTAVGAKTYDGTPIFGKTGIHEYIHTWMDGSSTEVTTVVWVGNVIGTKKLNNYYEAGWTLSRIRNAIWPDMQRAANAKYGGDSFPEPDATLTKRTYVTLPSVIGMSTEDAERTLENAGFSVNVGAAVDATESAGTIVEQSPGAGRVAAGTSVTIRPSNGKGSTVPAVSGSPQDAANQLRSAGFTNIDSSCSESDGAPQQGAVTGTDPAAGQTVSRDQKITIQYQAKNCDGNGNGNGRGDDD